MLGFNALCAAALCAIVAGAAPPPTPGEDLGCLVGFGPLGGAALCSLPPVLVPPPTPVTVVSGGGAFASGGGKRNAPCLDDLDVFKCLDEKRKPGQSIIECLREMDQPAVVECLVEAKAEVESLWISANERTNKEHIAEIRELSKELAAVRGMWEEQQAEVDRRLVEEEDDEDFLYLAAML